MSTAAGWLYENDEQVPTLPPDYTPLNGPHCNDEAGAEGWTCTRIPGHTGRHAAGDGEHILAVWP